MSPARSKKGLTDEVVADHHDRRGRAKDLDRAVDPAVRGIRIRAALAMYLKDGPLFIRETIKTLDRLTLKPADRRKIYFGNAVNMLRLELPKPKAGRKKASH